MGANLKEVRSRIKSVMSTQQITKAMKMVSAAKLRRAQTAITQLRPYSSKLNAVLSNILSNVEGDASSSFGVERPIENVVLVVITSNKGLCGAFNTNIIKAALEQINTQYADHLKAGKLTFLCIGKKGFEFFGRRYPNAPMIADYVDLFGKLTFEETQKVAERLMNGFQNKQYDAISIAYGQFKNAAMQNFITEQYLPVPKMEGTKGKAAKADFIFEPNQTQLLEDLIPSILKLQLFKCCLDTHASEHGARMTAMDKASENANELLKVLRINYNKARQEAITNELSEIVGGAAALEG